MTNSHSHLQRGVALITAMLLMVLGVMVAAKLSWDSQLHLRRATTAMTMAQARLFAMGAESIAIDAIRRVDEEPAFDLPEDDYLTPLTLPVGIEDVDMGVMSGQIEDLQGRLNLNNLLDSSGALNTKVQEQFARLFDSLNLNPAIVDAIVDWMDADTIPLLGGAEDGIYTSLDPAYRTGNTAFRHVSELRSVQGIGPDEYRLLRPFVTVLPRNSCGAREVTPLNLNFALAGLENKPTNWVEMVAALDPDISASDALNWAEIIAENAGLTDWTLLTGPQAVNPADQALQQLQLTGYVSMISHCFGLTVYVTIGSSVLSMYSVLERPDPNQDEIYVRQRIFGIENAD